MIQINWIQRKTVFSYNKEDPIHKKLAAIHGIENPQRFLYPTKEELHSPFLLKNIEKSRNRILHAIYNSEKISIFSDPDNDGICSTVIMYNYLKIFTDNLCYFHNQRSQGHGINTSMHLVPDDTRLLIIVDSSSSDTLECKILNSKGIDVIILDHHLIEQENPYCILVNPQQEDCNYPNKHISGATLAWKMCQVLDETLGTGVDEDFIDLVAIGMLGDQMNMLEYENRYLVKTGLENIKNNGIKSLLKVFGKTNSKNLTSIDILYNIVPALNSACRLDVIEIALSLLTEENISECVELAENLSKLNDERKTVQSNYYNELANLVDLSDKCSIIINDSIGAGYRGLIAGDLSGEFNKPVMVLSETEEGVYKGSYRSGDFDLKSVLNTIPEIIYAAGHPSAGGVSFKKSDHNKVLSQLNNLLPSKSDKNEVEYLLEFDLKDLNKLLIKEIDEFYKISGNGFDVGKFLVKGIVPTNKQILGKDRNTVKIECRPVNSKNSFNNSSYALMRFRTNESYFNEAYLNKQIEVIGTLNFNEYFNPRTKKLSKTSQVFLDEYRLVF